jgi:hypothetical protein
MLPRDVVNGDLQNGVDVDEFSPGKRGGAKAAQLLELSTAVRGGA